LEDSSGRDNSSELAKNLLDKIDVEELSDQCNAWGSEGSDTGTRNRPIVAFNSDPDVTIRYRDQYRTLSPAPEQGNTVEPAQHHKSDGDLFVRPLTFSCISELSELRIGSDSDEICSKKVSEAESLDDANKMNIVADDKQLLATLDDWIIEVEQKHIDLASKRPKNESKSDTGWSSEADLKMRPGSGLEQLSHFADRLVNQKNAKLGRNKSFAAIGTKSELDINNGKYTIVT
jgi:hypothetical protein